MDRTPAIKGFQRFLHQPSQVIEPMMIRVGARSNHPQSSDSSAKPLPRLADEWPLRILVVDDYLSDRIVTLRLLKALGYLADVARNGKEALNILQQRTYDVAFIDLHMPEMGGLAATRRISQDWPPAQRPCIIAVTSEPSAANRNACLEAGMDDCLSKPLVIGTLMAVLERCCDRTPQPSNSK